MYSHETSIHPSGTIASSWAVALIAVVAPPVLALVFLVAAAACLVAWPFAPVWAFVAHRRTRSASVLDEEYEAATRGAIDSALQEHKSTNEALQQIMPKPFKTPESPA